MGATGLGCHLARTMPHYPNSGIFAHILLCLLMVTIEPSVIVNGALVMIILLTSFPMVPRTSG